MRQLTGKKGFTIIEMLIVITLIALFATIAVINYEKTRRNIDFTNVFLNVTENLRSVRSNAITSRTESGKVPFAYGMQISAKAGDPVETTIFTDTDQKGSQQYIFDTAKGDTKVRDYTLPEGFTAAIHVKDSLNATTIYQLDKVNIAFMPPFGDVYISNDDPNVVRTYNKVQISIFLNEVGLKRFICLNTVGSVIEESVFPCIDPTL